MEDLQLDLFCTTNCDFEEEQKAKHIDRDIKVVKVDKVDKVEQPQPKFEQTTELNPRQWQLYRLIEHNSLVEHRKTTQKEICDTIEGYEWNDDEKCHDHCPAIWKDIATNNLSYEHQKLIISHEFEYWIGNEAETKVFLDILWQQIAPKLYRYWTYKNKVNQNGQGRLLDKNLNPIDDTSKARAFIESFNPTGVN